MQDYERSRASQWLREQRGDISQDKLAADITRTTGWTITRDRYSKYESGSLPFGKAVLGHFIDYWEAKGRPGPDLTPPAPELSYEERHLALLEEANAIARERLEQERVISSALMALLRQGSGRPDLVEQARAFAESLGRTPLTPLGDPTPSPGR